MWTQGLFISMYDKIHYKKKKKLRRKKKKQLLAKGTGDNGADAKMCRNTQHQLIQTIA